MSENCFVVKLIKVDKVVILFLLFGEIDVVQVLWYMGLKEVQWVGVVMVLMCNVYCEQVEQVMGEFVEVVGDQISFGVGVDGYICKMFIQVFGEDKVNNLIDCIFFGGSISGLDSLKWMELCVVVDVICYEYLQIQVIVVVYFDFDQVVEVFSYFDYKVCLDIVLCVFLLNIVQFLVLKEFNLILEKQFVGNFNVICIIMGGVKCVVDIMNYFDSFIEGQLMDLICEVDEDLFGQIEDLMFVFDNFVDVDDCGIQVLFWEVFLDVLVLVFKGFDEVICEKVFKNMFKCVVELLCDDLEVKGLVWVSEVEGVQKEIFIIVWCMVEFGDIVLGGKGGEEMI